MKHRGTQSSPIDLRLTQVIQDIFADPELRLLLKDRISEANMSRYLRAKNTPREKNIKVILECLPSDHKKVRLLQELYTEKYLPASSDYIPDEIVRRILTALRTSSWPVVEWTISNEILKDMLRQFDPFKNGIHIQLIRCTPSADGIVRTLRDHLSMGHAPLDGNPPHIAYHFYGEGSLIGHVAKTKEMITFVYNDPLPLAYEGHELEKSVCIHPLQRYGKVGGCVVVTSVLPDLFTENLQAVVGDYVTLLTLALEERYFFQTEAIQLAPLPGKKGQDELYYRHRFPTNLLSSSFLDNDHLAWRKAEQLLLSRALP